MKLQINLERSDILTLLNHLIHKHNTYLNLFGFPWWLSGKESVCQYRRPRGSIPGSGRSPEEGNGNPLQYSCLENSMDRGAWWTTVHAMARVGHALVTKQQQPFIQVFSFIQPCFVVFSV